MRGYKVKRIFIMQRFLLLLFTFIASCSPLSKYIDDPQNAKWKDEIQEFKKLDSVETYSNDAILFAGSSSIRLWDNIDEDMFPFKIIKRGYGGAKLNDFAYYAKEIIYPHKFIALVLFIANDISGSENDKTPKDVADLFSYTIDLVRDKYHDEPIFWIQITPTLNRWDVWDKTNEANNLIKEICENSDNLHFIETENLFLTNDDLPNTDLFIDDQLHLNKDGYQVWSEKIKSELNKRFN